MIKSKNRYQVVDQDTGEVLSNHSRLNGSGSARFWFSKFRKEGRNVAIRYSP
jgi:hypothetical protein